VYRVPWASMRTIRVVDSHTGGEPTRVVLEGGPPLDDEGSVAERLEVIRARHDRYRSAIVNEPRGSDALVGALLCEPREPGCAAGVIFFNNVGYLGMCGHGTIGLVVTLAHLGRLRPGVHRIETPVGIVTTELHDDGRVTIANVPSYRWTAAATVEVPGRGRVTGDVAWGGNWFFLVHEHDLDVSMANIDTLTGFAWEVRRALRAGGITGADGAEIDHIELLGPSPSGADSRSFVLCPGGAYDRSPCGTGTSAKLACLHADGKLRPDEVWRQESVTGSVFEGRFAVDPQDPRRILPRITGTAHVTGEATLVLDDRDPLCWGIRVTP
jgi:4-hydroxyproline epimerase